MPFGSTSIGTLESVDPRIWDPGTRDPGTQIGIFTRTYGCL